MGPETINREILRVLKQSKQPVSTREISLKTKRAWHSVNAHCLKLQLQGKVNGFRISNINVWELKKMEEGGMKARIVFILLMMVFLPQTVSAASIIDGDALLAYMEGNNTPPYRIWNGTNLGAEAYASDIEDRDDPDWVEIAASFTNFTALMAIQDTQNDVHVQTWNGTWSGNLEVTGSSREGDHSFDVAYESQSGEGMIAYNNRQDTPKYRIWDGNSWGSEQTAQDVGAEPEDMRLKSNPKRDEMILITRDSSSDINIQVWDGNAWNNQTQVTGSSTGDHTPIAVAFETDSGDGLAVWGDNDETPRYRIWNETDWSSSNLNALSNDGAVVRYIELASHPYTDEITMVTIDDGSDVNAQVWNGTDWTNHSEFATSGCNNGFCADVIYESKNNRSIVVYDDNTDTPKYRIWNGTDWGAEASIADVGAEPREVDLASHPNEDEVLLLIQDNDGDVHFFVWNTTDWIDKGAIGSGLNRAARKGVSAAYVVPPDNAPVVDNITESSDPIMGGTNITITANGASDADNNTLELFCDTSTTPNSTNTDCTWGTTSDSSPPYNLNCTFTVAADDADHTVYCRLYDLIGYSSLVNLTYTTDSTVPYTSVSNVSGDTAATYIDNVNDGYTNITVDGEANMVCRFGTSDNIYSEMSSGDGCDIYGTWAVCPAQPSQGTPDYYVSCQDAVGNEQSTSQNLDITDLLVDWTAPTTYDDSVTDIQTPTYTVTITEADNIDSDPDTLYCTDTANTCIAGTAIDSGGQVAFNSSHRGINYLRYNSTDDAGNQQTTVSRTININRLPVLTSASDDVGTIKGGTSVNITTVSNETDSVLGQSLFMYVCNATGASSSGCPAGATLCTNITNTSTNASCEFTSGTDDGTKTWYVYLFDGSEEGASNNPLSGSYTIDSTAPTITIIDPDNATYTQTSVTAQITLNEAGSAVLYSLDGGANTTMTKVSDTLFTATISGLGDQQNHNIIFYANDSVGNMGVSSVKYFTVDTTADDTTSPAIVVWSPTNGTHYSNTSVLFNITTDENLSWAGYSLDGGSLQDLDNVSMTHWRKTVTVPQGFRNITFYANDTATSKNQGSSSVIYFTADNTSPQFSTAGYTPTTVNDNASVTCYSSWTDNVELYQGIVEQNSSGSFVNTTVSLSGTSGDVNLTIPAANLTPGGFTCVFYGNDTTGNINSTSVSFTVNDVTLTVITNISYVPTTETDLDLDVGVNVTVNATDNFNLASVKLQFKESNASTFLNFTMDSLSGDLYTGNFTPNTTNNWTFRILAEDSSGNQQTSSETNLSVAQDKTWGLSDTIPSVKSIVQTENRIISLGNITINNTGDSPLEFNLSSDRSWITFNGTINTSLSANISSGSFMQMNVTANTTGFAVGLYNFTTTVTPNDTISSPPSNTTTGQINIQNTAGPYISVTITTYSSTVNKGDTGATFASQVENLGTADATGVWLAWELPAEFSLATGTLNKSIGNLIIGGSATNIITINVDSSADDKNVTVNATSNCIESSSDSASKTVTIGTPTTTTVTETTTTTTEVGGGGAAGGAGAVVDKILAGEEILSSAETFELVRGESNSFPVAVKNIFEGTALQSVSIKIEGYFSQYVSVSPDMIGEIAHGQEKQFIVTIVSPDYMEKGTHELTIIITGKIIGKKIEKDLVETRKVTLKIHIVSEEEASKGIDLAMADISGMLDAGFPTGKISKLLEEAKKALEEHDYDKAKELTEKIKIMKENAFDAHLLIQELKNKMSKHASITGSILGIQRQFTETENLVSLALAAFEREDYQTSLQRAKDAELALALEGGEFSPLFFLLDYWWAVLLSAVLLVSGGIFGHQRYVKVTISQKIRNLEKEEETVRGLIREVQKKHFKEGSLGPSAFHKSMSHYQKRLSKIGKLKVKLRHRRVRLLKPERVIKDLEEERKEVTRLLGDIQRGYFVKKTVAKKEYEEQTKAYNERLAEIEDDQMTTETRMSGGKK